MLTRLQHHLLVALAVVALLLVIANATIFTLNRHEQAALAQRQQYVSQTVALQGLYNDIVKTLAQRAVKDNDKPVLDMLAAQGIGVTVNVPGAGKATP